MMHNILLSNILTPSSFSHFINFISKNNMSDELNTLFLRT